MSTSILLQFLLQSHFKNTSIYFEAVNSDEYHRVDEHVKLMKDLGVNAYRFSIS